MNLFIVERFVREAVLRVHRWNVHGPDSGGRAKVRLRLRLRPARVCHVAAGVRHRRQDVQELVRAEADGLRVARKAGGGPRRAVRGRRWV